MTTTRTRPECAHIYPQLVDRECGVKICIVCSHHKDIIACYCGWSITGLDGKQYLQDKGEDID